MKTNFIKTSKTKKFQALNEVRFSKKSSKCDIKAQRKERQAQKSLSFSI